MGDFKLELELKEKLPTEVVFGIENHRFVDKTTDQFAAVKGLRALFSPMRRRFSGIITDIVFDYFLIKHWQEFEKLDFDLFVEECYQGLNESKHWMPPRMQKVVMSMRDDDWLRSYGTLAGIELSINQVSKRIRFENNMVGGVVNYDAIEAVFLNLFTHLQVQVSDAAIEA